MKKKGYKNDNRREELMVEEKQNKEWAKEKRRKKEEEEEKRGEGFWNLKEAWVKAKEKEPHIKVWFGLG